MKGFVQNLKESKGIDYVFVWHALSGYWGGVSTDMRYVLHSSLPAILLSININTSTLRERERDIANLKASSVLSSDIVSLCLFNVGLMRLYPCGALMLCQAGLT